MSCASTGSTYVARDVVAGRCCGAALNERQWICPADHDVRGRNEPSERPVSRLLRLRDCDNVAVALETLEPGSRHDLDGVDVIAHEAVPAGHKIALRAIATGEAVVKYGAEIGVASQPIAAGEYVHVHNLESTRLRGDQ